MDIAKVKNHIHELETRHRKLDNQVTELERNHADDEDIHYFKKKRLAIRDEIAKMEARLNG